MSRTLSAAATLLLLASTVASAPGETPASGDIAVIVHPEVPEDDLPLTEVQRLLLGDRQFWAAGLRVTLLIRAPVAREREVVLKKIYRMNEGQFRQYWIGKVFRAETVSGPKIVYSSDMAVQLVAAIPGSITFVQSSQVPTGVKVLMIDGKKPGDAGYPLR